MVIVKDLMAAAAAEPVAAEAVTMEDPVITLLVEEAVVVSFLVLVVPVKLIQEPVPAVLVVQVEVPAVAALVLLQQAAVAAGVHLVEQAEAISEELAEQP